MPALAVILLVAALIAFLLAAFGVGAPRINLLALGLACWALADLIPAIGF
jgi:hypothetical protein